MFQRPQIDIIMTVVPGKGEKWCSGSASMIVLSGLQRENVDKVAPDILQLQVVAVMFHKGYSSLE